MSSVQRYAITLDAGDKIAFETIDQVHLHLLRAIIAQTPKLDSVWSEEELVALCLIWHKLTPYKDTNPGLSLLKQNYIVASLSNGNCRLQIDQVLVTDY